ncbi:MAG: DUF3039 domain-containing protein [Actinobacteria bacterium]|nr:DUF3039 domain-containing protein [Actinomycetota bacterium]
MTPSATVAPDPARPVAVGRAGTVTRGRAQTVVTPPETIEAPARPELDDGDHDRFAHFCKKADIVRAHVTGEAIVALCGKRWVPTRDPSRYPVCPSCRELKDAGYTLR